MLVSTLILRGQIVNDKMALGVTPRCIPGLWGTLKLDKSPKHWSPHCKVESRRRYQWKGAQNWLRRVVMTFWPVSGEWDGVGWGDLPWYAMSVVDGECVIYPGIPYTRWLDGYTLEGNLLLLDSYIIIKAPIHPCTISTWNHIPLINISQVENGDEWVKAALSFVAAKSSVTWSGCYCGNSPHPLHVSHSVIIRTPGGCWNMTTLPLLLLTVTYDVLHATGQWWWQSGNILLFWCILLNPCISSTSPRMPV